MKVILTADVDRLGSAGDIVEVADGYGRNYLIPRGFAVLATEGAQKQVEKRRQAEERKLKRLAAETEALAQSLSQVPLHFKVRVGESERLFGSITSGNIAAALKEEVGEEIDHRKVELAEPIRELGTYRVPIRLTADLAPEVTVVVEAEEEE
ncbi:MAG: 50S ribosomal protein L9 [Anaerolineae bacterium]